MNEVSKTLLGNIAATTKAGKNNYRNSIDVILI